MYVCMYVCVCIYMYNNNIEHTQSISSGAQYVTLAKYFSHPRLVIYFLATPPIKLKLGWQMITNSNPPKPIIMMGQSETLISSEIVFITLFSARTHTYWAFYQPLRIVPLYRAKTIFLSQTGIFLTFLHPIVLCRMDRIQSTAGDALIQFWASTIALSLSCVICLYIAATWFAAFL